jgi:hypothetical protein
MKKALYYILIWLAFAGCEKEITVDLPHHDPIPVIEGGIEQGGYPWVFISRSAGYFDKFDSLVFVNMIDTTATVIVSNGSLYDTLSLTLDPFQFPFFKYEGNKFTGEAGATYYLQVITGGKTYTAETTIPYPITLDSLKFKPETGYDTLGYIWLYLFDPPGPNYYRLFTKVIGKDVAWVHPFPSTTDDKFFDNQKAEYSVYRGRNPLEDNLYDDNGLDADGVPRWFFRASETVAVKLTTIDKEHYDFWYSVEQQYMTDGNPFASPVSVITNIQGGAVGVWGGYGVFIDTLVIPQSLSK